MGQALHLVCGAGIYGHQAAGRTEIERCDMRGVETGLLAKPLGTVSTS